MGCRSGEGCSPSSCSWRLGFAGSRRRGAGDWVKALLLNWRRTMHRATAPNPSKLALCHNRPHTNTVAATPALSHCDELRALKLILNRLLIRHYLDLFALR